MKKWVTALFLVGVVLLWGATASGLLIDGVSGLIWGTRLSEDTVYAPGYSDAAFRRITVGMTIAEVHRRLGPPLRTWALSPSSDPGEIGERWSYSPGDTNYRCRVLLFRSGRVFRKHAEFYVD